jgi:hypothetical protein
VFGFGQLVCHWVVEFRSGKDGFAFTAPCSHESTVGDLSGATSDKNQANEKDRM